MSSRSVSHEIGRRPTNFFDLRNRSHGDEIVILPPNTLTEARRPSYRPDYLPDEGLDECEASHTLGSTRLRAVQNMTAQFGGLTVQIPQGATFNFSVPNEQLQRLNTFAHAPPPGPVPNYPQPAVYVGNNYTHSPNYMGNANLEGNQSANIPEHESCSLWITNLNLPPTEQAAYQTLLHAIRGCGKIYACVINWPEPGRGHMTCAAKVVFWDKSGAAELRRRAAAGQFVFNNFQPKVVYNRIRTASQRPGQESRVIHIEGHKSIVDKDVLFRFFSENFKFQTDEVIVCMEEPGQDGRRRLEWRFGSYRCQSASAMKFIEERRHKFPPGMDDQHNFWGQVHAYYALDPCDPATPT